MVYLMHCLKNLLFFDILLLYCYTTLNSSIICCLSSGYMYLLLFLYFVNLQWIFSKHLLFYQQFYYQSNHQLLMLFFKLFCLMQFLLHLLQILQRYQEVFDLIYCLHFCPCFQQKTKIHMLLRIFFLRVQLNISFLYN